MKICSTCRVQKPFKDFHKRSKALDGHQGVCKDCNKSQRKTYYKTAHGRAKNGLSSKGLRTSRRDKFYEYLSDKECMDCGISDPVVFEFDHRDPSQKEFNISFMVASVMSWDKILIEIGKCDIVCANCHRIRTAKMFGWHKYKMGLSSSG